MGSVKESAGMDTPELTGYTIYRRWKRIVLEEHDPVWNDLGAFVFWLYSNGYHEGCRIQRVNGTAWGPDNCVIVISDEAEDDEYSYIYTAEERDAAIARWNATVNRIRAARGLPLL